MSADWEQICPNQLQPATTSATTIQCKTAPDTGMRERGISSPEPNFEHTPELCGIQRRAGHRTRRHRTDHRVAVAERDDRRCSLNYR